MGFNAVNPFELPPYLEKKKKQLQEKFWWKKKPK